MHWRHFQDGSSPPPATSNLNRTGTVHLWKLFFWSFLTNTKREWPLPGLVWLFFAWCTSLSVPLFWAKTPPGEGAAVALFNPTLHNRLRHFDVHWRWCLASNFFIFLTYLTTLITCVMVVNDTMNAKHNMEKKTREAGRKSWCITSVVFPFSETGTVTAVS